MDYFTGLKKTAPDVIELMIEMEDNPFNSTFKYGFRMENLRDQRSLDEYFELDCTEYCYV